MGLVVSDPPTEYPVTVAEIKEHSRIDIDDDDGYIGALIAAATADSEAFLWRSLITREYTLTMDRFPFDDYIELPKPPLASVVSVKYYDTANVLQTLTGYEVDTATEPGRIYIDRSTFWPSCYWRRNAVEIVYTAGYGAAADIPDLIKHGIKFKVAHWYEQREPIVTGTIVAEAPMTAKRIDELTKFRGDFNIYACGIATP